MHACEAPSCLCVRVYMRVCVRACLVSWQGVRASMHTACAQQWPRHPVQSNLTLDAHTSAMPRPTFPAPCVDLDMGLGWLAGSRGAPPHWMQRLPARLSYPRTHHDPHDRGQMLVKRAGHGCCAVGSARQQRRQLSEENRLTAP